MKVSSKKLGALEKVQASTTEKDSTKVKKFRISRTKRCSSMSQAAQKVGICSSSVHSTSVSKMVFTDHWKSTSSRRLSLYEQTISKSDAIENLPSKENLQRHAFPK